MARIAGVDLPRNKHISIALTYIFGIGNSRAKSILGSANVQTDKKVSDLNALISPGSPLYLLNADSIINSSEIVGQACVLPDCSTLVAFRERQSK